jgi:PAS domain S-box-containing protein
MKRIAQQTAAISIGLAIIYAASASEQYLMAFGGICLTLLALQRSSQGAPPKQLPPTPQAAFDTLEKSSFLMQNLAAAILLRNKEDRIIYCSPFTEVLTGYSVQEVQSRDEDFFISIMHEEDREKYQRALEICRAGEPFQFRFRFTHRSGIEIWAETRTVPLLDESGNLTASLAVLLDVTGTVRYQKQVEEKNRDLQDFTYMLSHDLKAPLSTIQGMINILKEDHLKELPVAGSEVVGHIERAAERLQQLVQRVLEFSRLSTQEFKTERIALNDTLIEVEKDFETQLQACKGSLKVAQPLPHVQGDSVHLYRVFANIIGNAIKYRDPQRPLQINVCVTQEARRAVTISISDNGYGIAAEELPKLFRPFHRATKLNIEGSGIGLASVHRILEQMGGSIRVESTLGKGSTFYVQLRRSQ